METEGGPVCLPSLSSMHGLFPDVDEVQLDHVREFLADAGEEGVTWEAKADDDEERTRPEGEQPGRLRKNTIRKAVSGLANQIGGYLVIGARWDKDAQRWHLPGVLIDASEPELWLQTVIDSGTAPAPRCRIKSWSLDRDRTVALVEVEPVAQPPCMTSQGHVYERVSGETRRVTDPVHLDGLFRRGREARAESERRAVGAANDLAGALDLGGIHAAVALAIAPIGRDTDDISSRLFTPGFGKHLEEALSELLPRADSPEQTYPSMSQAGITAQAMFYESLGPDEPFDTPLYERSVRKVWAALGRWDGTVAAGASFNAEELGYVSMFDELIAPAWTALVPLVARLGGFGPARLVIVIVGAGGADEYVGSGLLAQVEGSVLVQRDIDLEPPSTDQIGSIQREVQRSAGILTYEPEPDAGQEP